jgi:hypothetical protein
LIVCVSLFVVAVVLSMSSSMAGTHNGQVLIGSPLGSNHTLLNCDVVAGFENPTLTRDHGIGFSQDSVGDLAGRSARVVVQKMVATPVVAHVAFYDAACRELAELSLSLDGYDLVPAAASVGVPRYTTYVRVWGQPAVHGPLNWSIT